MVFWEDPNTNDPQPPGSPSTFGTGGGVDLNYADIGETPTSNGLWDGALALDGPFPSWPNSKSIGTQIEKTISIVNDLASSIRPATVRLSDSARIPFDNAISVRLEAAEEFNLLTDFFRTKYLIKAY